MFKVLNNNISNQFTIKKSKFFTYGYFVQTKDQIKDILDSLWKQYPDATHICYGYILDDNTYYYSDDGEPTGTAGIPIYNAIKSLGINYCLVCVVRYFGGIKFGPGPLRQTFRDVTINTLKVASLSQATLKDIIEIEVPLSQSKKYINLFSILIKDKRYDKENVILTLAGSKEELVSRLMPTKLKVISIKEKQIVKQQVVCC